MKVTKESVVGGVLLAAALLGLSWLSRNFFVDESQTNSNLEIHSEAVQGTVEFHVNEAVYARSISEGETALELMRRIDEEEEDFSFSGSDSSFGFFVESINGIANDNDASDYWTLYVNGAMAQVGVSDLVLTNGDNINWKYEHVEF